MANVQATLRARLPREQDLARLAGDLDRDLYANTPPEVYLTLFVGIVDPRTRVMRYVNAGHNTQFILRRTAGIEAMSSTGRPLGLLPGGGLRRAHAPTCRSAMSSSSTRTASSTPRTSPVRCSGASASRRCWRNGRTSATGVDDVLERVESALRAFRGQAEQPDDATMMALRLGAE